MSISNLVIIPNYNSPDIYIYNILDMSRADELANQIFNNTINKIYATVEQAKRRPLSDDLKNIISLYPKSKRFEFCSKIISQMSSIVRRFNSEQVAQFSGSSKDLQFKMIDERFDYMSLATQMLPSTSLMAIQDEVTS